MKGKSLILSVALLATLAISGCTITSDDSSSSSVTTTTTSSSSDITNKYYVTVEGDESFTVNGISSEGYDVGDTVSFTISVTTENVEVESVTSNQVDNISNRSGLYTFIMPESDVTITVTFKTITSDISGEGTEDEPYIIENKAQLASINEQINNGVLSNDGYYRLANDIDMDGVTYTSIGTESLPFSGTFDGNGYTISNITLDIDITTLVGGLFAYTSSAYIFDITLDNVITDSLIYGASSRAYFGGIVAYAENSVITSCSVSYTTFNITSLQNNYSYLYVGGLIGYISSLSGSYGTALYDEISYNSVEGDISVDTGNADMWASYVGGLIAYTYVGYYVQGIISITNSYYVGNINGGTAIGGIVAFLDSYCSVVDCYAVGSYLISYDSEGSYVGGIVAHTDYETAVINTYAEYNTLTAPSTSGSSYYASYAGTIVGYIYEDGYSEGYDYMGTAIVNSYYLDGVSVTANNVYTSGIALSSISSLSSQLNLSDDIWDFNSDYPTLKDDIVLSEITITIDSQGNGDNNIVIYQAGLDYEASEIIDAITYSKQSYSYNGLTYDSEGSQYYRWYVPIFNDITLYAKFSDKSVVIGTYTYECEYYGRITGTGYFIFDENYFYWISDADYSIYTYEYELQDNYIFVGSGVPTATGEAYGGYSNTIFVLNSDGTITGWDLNDSDAVYTATKTDEVITLPDYTGSNLLGTWYTSGNVEFTLYYDTTALGKRQTQSYYTSGSFRINDNSLSIVLFGVLSTTYTYYEEYNILVGADNSVAARVEISSTISSSDDSIYGYVIDGNTYIISNGVLVEYISGTLTENQVITINDVNYEYTDGVLTVEVIQEPGSGSSSEPTYVGTWTGRLGLNTVTIVIYDDGTLTYGSTTCEYTVDGNVISATAPYGVFTLTITYNSDNQSITVVYEDDDYNYFSGTFTDYTPFETQDSSSYFGVWSGNTGSGASSITINSDGTGYYGELAFTWTETGENTIYAVLTSDSDISVTMIYDPDNDTLSFTYYDSYEYYSVSGTMTILTPEA